ncbi:hypothetical protein SDC9_143850 [bioreactor metagenome]|uniref:Uncharacterized protein n=1 Tax=bioreactor metagenome TaxID=1076179 RepID=A0A645E5A7_9ZZZZ
MSYPVNICIIRYNDIAFLLSLLGTEHLVEASMNVFLGERIFWQMEGEIVVAKKCAVFQNILGCLPQFLFENVQI